MYATDAGAGSGGGGRGFAKFYAVEKFTPEQARKDEAHGWRTTKIFYGGKHRKIRYKEKSGVYWQRGAKQRSAPCPAPSDSAHWPEWPPAPAPPGQANRQAVRISHRTSYGQKAPEPLHRRLQNLPARRVANAN